MWQNCSHNWKHLLKNATHQLADIFWPSNLYSFALVCAVIKGVSPHGFYRYCNIMSGSKSDWHESRWSQVSYHWKQRLKARMPRDFPRSRWSFWMTSLCFFTKMIYDIWTCTYHGYINNVHIRVFLSVFDKQVSLDTVSLCCIGFVDRSRVIAQAEPSITATIAFSIKACRWMKCGRLLHYRSFMSGIHVTELTWLSNSVVLESIFLYMQWPQWIPHQWP